MTKDERDTLMEFLHMPLENAGPVLEKFASLPGAIHRGEGLESFVYVPGSRKDRVVLVAHADTFWDSGYYSGSRGRAKDFRITEKGGILKNKYGCLGADDRAGCAILWLFKDLGHTLLVTNGEENGRLGAEFIGKNGNEDVEEEINQSHQFAVEFDRCNGRDFKCYSVGTDEFRSYVAAQTGFTEPNRNSFTDIVSICKTITGVNLSVGYSNEHDESEQLDLSLWENTLRIARSWLGQDNLPKFSLRARSADF